MEIHTTWHTINSFYNAFIIYNHIPVDLIPLKETLLGWPRKVFAQI